MKKSTKIITTAIALVLVLGFMVVGILAATSATAGISSSVSWTAEAGVHFSIDAWTYYSAEHYDEVSKSFPEVSGHKIDTIIVDSATTNQSASGISKNLNASFIDTTDDGVNNPHELYYFYYIQCLDPITSDSNFIYYPQVHVTLSSSPKSNSNVQIEILSDAAHYVPLDEEYKFIDRAASSSTLNNRIATRHIIYALKLTLLNPDESLANCDAGVSFSILASTPYREPQQIIL